MVKKYPDFERGESASETGRTHIPPRVFKEMARLGQLKDMLMQRLSEVTPLNAKRKSAEIEALLDKYIPAAEKMMTRMKKLKKICTELKAELAQLEKEKDASKESVLRRLELEQQVRELENAQKVLEAIPDDVLAQYRTAVKEENAYSHQK